MLIGLNAAELLALLVAGILLDRLLGEPPRWHPLVGFGRLADVVERGLNRAPESGKARLHGVAAMLLAVAPFVALLAVFTRWPDSPHWLAYGLHALALTLALGAKSLGDHVKPIAAALSAQRLDEARLLVQRIVSRDTRTLDETGVARAAVESTLENGNDAVFAALFWFLLAGAPGVVLYRLVNTLDAMWGYRNARFLHFGWAAARFDDLLNFVPARLTALTYALLGRTANALACWRAQAPAWASPNAGPVMAAGAAE